MIPILVLAIIFPPSLARFQPCSNLALQKELNHEAYFSLGDINIGALFSITQAGSGLQCTKKIQTDTWGMKYVEAVAFAVDTVNNDPTLLPNIKLGFVILDHCGKPNTALAKALAFLPTQTCQSRVNQTLTATNTYYDVIGVIGTFYSSSTLLVSFLYAVAKLPLISFMSTSDLLSDKGHHPYFLRVVPSDQQQVLAMLTFIADQGWTYVSIVYEEGAYGQMAYENFKLFVAEYGICFAVVHKFTPTSSSVEVVRELLEYPRARVVILFLTDELAMGVLKASTTLGSRGHFIWVGSDGLSEKLVNERTHFDELVGTFVLMYYVQDVVEFTRHFNNINVSSSKNPWLKKYWELHGNCSFNKGNCTYKDPTNFEGFRHSKSTSHVMDSVLTFAHATQRLIEDLCPTATKEEIKKCIKGEHLIKYLYNTSFQGLKGKIQFDAKGNLVGNYEIRQIKLATDVYKTWKNLTSIDNMILEEAIGTFDTATRKLTYTGVDISWDHLLERDPILNPLMDAKSKRPLSVCSNQCLMGEYRVQLDVPCCWECRQCRSNERITEGGTRCETCLEFTWPDPATNMTTCRHISIEFSSIYGTIPMVEIALSLVAIIILISVAIFYTVHREHRVIIASCRELSYLQMTGLLLGYVSVIVFQTKPNDVTCGCLFFMYCLSFAWLYSPLIVKAFRIYRMFITAKYKLHPQFTSPRAQLFLANVLIAIQVIICIIVFIAHRPAAKISQPNLLEMYVELSCEMTLPGLASFLGYTLFLLAVCSVFAFKTRRLPENFNESLFISMCVSTTLIIWLSFMATYFTASRDYVKVLLLSMTLLLNHSVAIVLLFIPKIYAVLVVDPMKIYICSPSIGSGNENRRSTSANLFSADQQQFPRTSVQSLAKKRQSRSESIISGLPRMQSPRRPSEFGIPRGPSPRRPSEFGIPRGPSPRRPSEFGIPRGPSPKRPSDMGIARRQSVKGQSDHSTARRLSHKRVSDVFP